MSQGSTRGGNGIRGGTGIKWYLERFSEAGEKWFIPINSFPFVIGRDESCNLRLQSRWISRQHAELRVGGDTLWIRDLGSKNGTFINRRPVREAELLEAGDTVGFGRSEFVVRSGESLKSDLGTTTCTLDSVDELALPIFEHEQVLLRLLQEQKIVPHFQPIVRFSDYQVVGYEVLGRICEGELPMDIVELFYVASLLGHAARLSAFIREAGINTAMDLSGEQWLFLNIHPVEMYELDELVSSLRKVCNPERSHRIILEINEKAVTDYRDMRRFRQMLIELGISLAYDDFGVGHTRLAELAKAPPDFLKFDISLTREIHLAPKRLHQMVLTFVKGAQDLGIATVAEGIECMEENETCRQLGFDYAQGYFFGKPSPMHRLEG